MASKLLSNKAIAGIATILFAIIILDGKAYNRAPQPHGIYALQAQPEITVSKNSQTIVQFEHSNGRWHLTDPFIAPANGARIQALLDTNLKTSRSFHKDELQDNTIFNDAISLIIGNNLYLLGQLETVSKLRYVLADDTVYLQADHILPMLRAGQSAFVDLTVTNKINQATINGEQAANKDHWSDIKSLGLISTEQLQNNPVASVSLATKDGSVRQFQLYSADGIAALVPTGAAYGYLLSSEQSEKLGVTQFL